MAQITVEDILAALDEANVKIGRLGLQRDGLLKEIVELSRLIAQQTKKKEKKNGSN